MRSTLMSAYRLAPLLALALLLAPGLSRRVTAATLTVTSAADGGPGTLRAAVAAAGPGDTITFAVAGTITLTSGKLKITQPITIQGPGASTLAIDGNHAFGAFEIANPVGTVVLSGLTVQNGNATISGVSLIGGGVSVDSGATATLTGCTLSQNTAIAGGGLFNAGTAALVGCTFLNNTAPTVNDGGGGVGNSGTITVLGCTFIDNSAPMSTGGGIESGGIATVTGCNFSHNSADQGGGAFVFGTANLTDCTFSQNSATSGGGGVYNGIGFDTASDTMKMMNCILTSNSDYGLYNFGTVTLVSCSLTGNSGAGVLNTTPGFGTGGGATLIGCTLTGNGSSGLSSGGIVSNGTLESVPAPFALIDSIVYGNLGGEISGTGTASHCDIGETLGSGSDNVTDGGGNINAAPKFFSSVSPYDVHLQSGSPCAGAGTPVASLTTDLDGRPRANPPAIGACEALTYFSTLVVANPYDGVPQSLRAAIAYANDYPDTNITFDPATFASPQTIKLTQGELKITKSLGLSFSPTGVGLSSLAIDGNNASRVFEITGPNRSTNFNVSVDFYGLTIQNGSASTGNGGGVLVDSGATLIMTDCVLTNCVAVNGGGLYNQGLANIIDSVLAGNSASGSGGGAYNLANSQNSLFLTDCTLTNNNAPNGTGGALYNQALAYLSSDIFYNDTGGEIVNSIGPANTSYCDIGEAIGVNGDGITDNGHNINANPEFVSGYAPYDLHVRPDSPVIGSGYEVSGQNIDILGIPRANPPTIGAYEYQSAPTTTALVSSLDPSMAGQAVTFTVTVSGAGGPPTGMVTFADTSTSSTTTLGTRTLVGGHATFTTSGLSAGIHTITAVYGGDIYYLGSTSVALTQTVNRVILHTFPAGLQMIALDESYGSAAAWSAPAGQSLYTWGGAAYGLTTSLPAPGQGAWVRLTQPAALYDTGTHAAGPVSLPLTQGWNLVGDPFGVGVPLSVVTASAHGTTYPLSGPQSLVSTVLYTYPAGATAYQAVGPAGSLAPFAGYWLYAFQPCTLTVPAPANG